MNYTDSSKSWSEHVWDGPEPNVDREHLNRCHKLPEFSCARCLESFAKESLLVKHQRADKACRIKEAPRNSARNLADGFNKEQADQLKKARNGPGHEKWMGWYCILFEEEDPKSPHLPSPCK